MRDKIQAAKKSALVNLRASRLDVRRKAAIEIVSFAICGSSKLDTKGIFRLKAEEGNYRGQYVRFHIGSTDGRLGTTIDIGVSDIQSCAHSDDLILNLILERAFEIEAPERAFRSVTYKPATVAHILAQTTNPYSTSLLTTLLRRLQHDNHDILLTGHSASGKTILACQAAHALEQVGWRSFMMDLSDQMIDASDLIYYLANDHAATPGQVLIIIDDVQANPTEFRRIYHLTNKLRNLCDAKFRLLMVGWESAKPMVNEITQNIIQLQCDGYTMSNEILTQNVDYDNHHEEFEELMRKCRGNVLLAKLGSDYISKMGVLPSDSELSEMAWNVTTKSLNLSTEERKLLYYVCSLSQYQIDVMRTAIDSRSADACNRLINKRVLRVTGNSVAVGHSSNAALILRHIIRKYNSDVFALPSPTKIAIEYLRGAGDRQIAITLERLDFARLGRERNDQHGTAILARAWESFNILLNQIIFQMKIDKTWGDNIASSIFAAIALSAVRSEYWEEIAQYVRGRWNISTDDGLPIPLGESTKERVDFNEIKKAMIHDEELRSYEESAEDIDFDLFHRTWVLGLLLEFEGTAKLRDPGRIRILCDAAATSQLHDGSFYPARVPWVTARIVLGLTSVGESVFSSNVVRRACEWIQRSEPLGPFSLACWESGTGTWNTAELTTAMCLMALLKSGVNPRDSNINAAHSFIVSQRSDWMIPGREIDAAIGLQAFMLVKRNWREITTELDHLLMWARKKSAWLDPSRNASELQTESSKSAFIANVLIGIVWDIVTAELPLLLEQLAPPEFDLSNSGAMTLNSKIVVILDAIEEIGDAIRTAILVREEIGTSMGVEPGTEIYDTLTLWHGMRIKLLSIKDRMNKCLLSGGSHENESYIVSIVTDLDELGNKCKGKMWVKIDERKWS